VYEFDATGRLVVDKAATTSAYDGDDTTAWFGPAVIQQPIWGENEGVGLILDFGTSTHLAAATLVLPGQATLVSLLVPRSDLQTLRATIEDWQVAAVPAAIEPPSSGQSHATVDFTLDLSTRYIMVLFHDQLPQTAAGSYQAGLSEISLQG
jgi:hypothetical protein